MMDTRGCASLTPGYMPRLRLGLTCFACPRHPIGRMRYTPDRRPKDANPSDENRRDLAVGERSVTHGKRPR